MQIQVKDYMSTSVLTAEETHTIAEVRSLMESDGAHAIPIIEYSRDLPDQPVSIRGIVTTTDLSGAIHDDNLPITEVMTRNVYLIDKEASIGAAANMMFRQHVHHLVVMDDGKVSGMLSSLDFVRLVAKHFPEKEEQ